MRELDVLLTRYLEERFCSASAAEQEAFRWLLDTKDTVIHAYCLGHERPATPPLAALIRSITDGARGET
jgi:succinate dehydrogenase flavin-adding protein (antitoxin of CptAB toxin-antitoxin module)